MRTEEADLEEVNHFLPTLANIRRTAIRKTKNGGSVMELIGAAPAVVTLLVANLIAPYSVPASRP